MNDHLPLLPSYFRKKPLCRLPSWLTKVWVPLSAVGLTQADTVKDWLVSTTGPLVVIVAPAEPFITAAESDQETPSPAAAVNPSPVTSWTVFPDVWPSIHHATGWLGLS